MQIQKAPRSFWITKRVFDTLAAVLLLPVVLLAAVFVFVMNPFKNPGPLVYSQMRVGKDGKLFRIYKFRTMMGQNLTSKFATDEMSRISKFGKFLRAKRIDELPQIVNVLLGHMSFIGPRPEQQRFVDDYAKVIPNYQKRHDVRPGISGLAQVMFGYTDDAQGTRSKLRYDLKYIREAGFRMEFFVVWKTIVTILTGFGAK